MEKKFYITTAIDYVNARPHIGHAFEKVLADAIARWNSKKGRDVFFLTGVDENAQKNVQAAEKAGVSVKEFVDKNTGFFLDLVKELNISHNKFVRTSAKEHSKVVHEILSKIIENGDIYKSKYEGFYCEGCEAYITEKDLVDGKCPEHNKEPKWMSEEAYFFKLSKYQKKLSEFVKDFIVPQSRKKEILSRISEGLNDICVSRSNVDWGIDFPKDKKYKVYVWIDALINYVSGAKEKWPADVHVIGKGINWFHSVIWPAILMSAGYKLPKTLLVHGYLNVGGKKMSKTLGNVIDPLHLLEKYGADTLRYSLLRCNVFDDSDFSEEIVIDRHNNELANKLGNLVSRVSGLIEKNGIEKTEVKLLKKLNEKKINTHMERYELDRALNEIFAFIDLCNEYVQSKKPWETGDKKVLYELKESILKIAELLWPFIPSTSDKITKIFGGKNIVKAEPLFVKIEEEKVNKSSEIREVMQGVGSVDFSEWQKLDLRVAEVLDVEDIGGADKLYKIYLDVGELGKRTVAAGLKPYYKKEKLKGKKIIYFSNLKPKNLKGVESHGMILAAVSEDHKKVILLTPDGAIGNGSRVS